MKTNKILESFEKACKVQNENSSIFRNLQYQFTQFPDSWESRKIKTLKNILKDCECYDKVKIELLRKIYFEKSKMNIFNWMAFGVGTLLTIEGFFLGPILSLTAQSQNLNEIITFYKSIGQLWIIITLPIFYFMWGILFFLKSNKTKSYSHIIAYLDEILLSFK